MFTYKDFKIPNLVPIAEMLQKAKAGKYAVGQYNINNLEWTRAILESAQEKQSPVILGLSEGAAKYFGGYKTVMGLVTGMIQDLKITVPVAVHLDHGSSLEVCQKAIEAGLPSVMIDASHHPIDENIAMVKKVSEFAHSHHVSVEAEVGVVGGEEDGITGEIAYADVNECVRLAKEAHLDALAASLGSVHGHYHGEPKLDFERMKEVSQKTGLPLVLHGGTGIPDEMIKKAIAAGQCKINVNTENQDAFYHATKDYFMTGKDKLPKGFDPRKILKPGFEAIKVAVKTKMDLFGSSNKA